ncbi:MAG: hypothetical protein QOD57_879, partial [Actinomycetota bacterium]|nr:hypothetical protein [Actinomycetota bacterium]
MRALLVRGALAKPLLAAALVGASTWVGASPAGIAPGHGALQVAAADLPVAPSSTSTSMPPSTAT